MVIQNHEGNLMNMVIYVKGAQIARTCPILPKLYITRTPWLFELIFGMVIQNHEGNLMNMIIYVKGAQIARACPDLSWLAQFFSRTRTACLFDLIFCMIIQNHEGNLVSIVICVKGAWVTRTCPDFVGLARFFPNFISQEPLVCLGYFLHDKFRIMKGTWSI